MGVKAGLRIAYSNKKLAHLALSILFRFAVVILHNEQSTSIEIYGYSHSLLYLLALICLSVLLCIFGDLDIFVYTFPRF